MTAGAARARGFALGRSPTAAPASEWPAHGARHRGRSGARPSRRRWPTCGYAREKSHPLVGHALTQAFPSRRSAAWGGLRRCRAGLAQRRARRRLREWEGARVGAEVAPSRAPNLPQGPCGALRRWEATVAVDAVWILLYPVPLPLINFPHLVPRVGLCPRAILHSPCPAAASPSIPPHVMRTMQHAKAYTEGVRKEGGGARRHAMTRCVSPGRPWGRKSTPHSALVPTGACPRPRRRERRRRVAAVRCLQRVFRVRLLRRFVAASARLRHPHYLYQAFLRVAGTPGGGWSGGSGPDPHRGGRAPPLALSHEQAKGMLEQLWCRAPAVRRAVPWSLGLRRR